MAEDSVPPVSRGQDKRQTPATRPPRETSGRTAWDATVEVVRLLGRGGPYAVFLVVILYAIQQIIAVNNTKLLEVEKARTEGLEKNAAEVDRLNKLVRDNAADMEKLRSAQFDSIAKATDLSRSVTSAVLAVQASLSEQREQLFNAQRQLAETQNKLNAEEAARRSLNDELDALRGEEFKAENVISDASLILGYLGDPGQPGTDRTDLTRRFLRGDPQGMSRAEDGTAYYGVFRIPAKAMADLIRYIRTLEPNIAERLIQAGGADAAAKGDVGFRAEWRSLAHDPIFEQLQISWIDDTMYNPLLAAIGRQLNRAGTAEPFAADQHSLALQAELWSISVQEGSHTDMVRRAWTGVDLNTANDAKLVCALFGERMNVSDYKPDATDTAKRLLRARYRLELHEAFRMLQVESKDSPSGECDK